jgi:hypothetical protein
MHNLHYFLSTSAFTEAYNDPNEYHEPWLSYIKGQFEATFNKHEEEEPEDDDVEALR